MSTFVTYADFAREMEVSAAAVSQGKKRIAAALVTQPDGKQLLDLELARELWKNSKRERRDGNQGKRRKPPTPAPATTSSAPPSDKAVEAYIMGLPEDQIPADLSVILRRKEHYNAEQSRLKALKERGELGSIASMEREAFSLGRSIRDGVLAVVPRVSADLAALADSFEVEQVLRQELEIALRALTSG